MNGRTGWVTPETIHEPREKSRVYGWRYEKSGFILSLEGPGVPTPTHTHTPTLHTKRHTKENFLKNRMVASTPILSTDNPPMTPWRDARAMGWVGA